MEIIVRNRHGELLGWKCMSCGGTFANMWGDTCDRCQTDERRHRELIMAIKQIDSQPPQQPIRV